ncbi:MAG: hypothetical protein ACPIOQ_45200 [Promethearchaeia archaeon]
MTQRVLCQKQEQEGKGRASDPEQRAPSSTTTLALPRGVKPENGAPW